MSDESDSPRDEANKKAPEIASGEGDREAEGEGRGGADSSGEAEAPPQAGRVDEDGLPLDRDATIDDVRSTEARHGRFAAGCTLLIVLLIAAFWAIRGGFIG